jgi:hypothetical protein
MKIDLSEETHGDGTPTLNRACRKVEEDPDKCVAVCCGVSIMVLTCGCIVLSCVKWLTDTDMGGLAQSQSQPVQS